MNFYSHEVEERCLNLALAHVAARVHQKVVEGVTVVERYDPPLNVWVDLPAGQEYSIHHPNTITTEEEDTFVTFLSKDLFCVSNDKALIYHNDYQVRNSFRVGAEVRIKNKGLLKGRIQIPLVAGVWVVEFNRDPLQRGVFKEDELELCSKWRNR